MSTTNRPDFDLDNEGIRQCFSKVVPETATKFSEVTELHFCSRKVTQMPPSIEKAINLVLELI